MGTAPPLTSEEALRQAQVEGLTLRVADNKTGYHGVKLGQGRSMHYRAQVKRGGKQVCLGRFATAEEAALCVVRSPEGREAMVRAAALPASLTIDRATSMVTPRGPAPPEPNAEQRGTKTFTSPYHALLAEQLPLLPGLLYNGEREKMLSQRWKALSEIERASYNVLEGPPPHSPALAMARAPAASRRVMTTAPPVMVGDSTASAMPAAASAAAPLAAPTMAPTAARNPPLYRSPTLSASNQLLLTQTLEEMIWVDE